MGSATVNIVLPLFGILLTGYFAGRSGLFGETSSAVLNRFVFVVSLPALVFVSLSRVTVDQFFNWPFLGTLGGGMLATYLISMAVARVAFPGGLTQLGLHGLTAMYSSTGYIGLPILLIAFGNEALVPGIIGAVITGAVFLPLAIILAEVDNGGKDRAFSLTPLINVARNPIFMATAAGLLVSASGFQLPKPVGTFCDLLGGAFTPCALFSAGLYMVGCSVKGDGREIGWLVVMKLAVHPLITWWLAYHVFELDGILPAIAVIQAALPCGVPVFVLAQQYGTFVARANAVVVISTVLSVVTLSVLLGVLVT
ncbi:MAG: AEC family transporter [Pseudomonadota bacterium]